MMTPLSPAHHPQNKRSHEDIRYATIVTPASMRSSYWKYFGFPADKSRTIITRSKIICKLCKNPIAYNKNTSNLRTHLNAKHPEYTIEITACMRQPKFIYDTTNCEEQLTTEDEIDHFVTVEEMIAPNAVSNNKLDFENVEYLTSADDNATTAVAAAANHQQQIIEKVADEAHYGDVSMDGEDYVIKPSFSRSINVKIDKHFANMIVTDLLPINVIEGKGFRRLFQEQGDIMLPNQLQMQSYLRKMYHDKKKNEQQWLKTKLSKKHFSIGFDKWTNFEHKDFVTVTISYVDSAALKTHTFGTVTNRLSVDWEDYFKFLDMKKCSMAILNYEPIDDDDEGLLQFLELKGIPRGPCLVHIITTIGQRCFSLPTVNSILTKSILFRNETEQLLSLDPPDIHPEFWLTKYDFLEYIGNVYMPSFETTDDELQQLHLDVKTLLDCLIPLKIILETLNMEQNALSSLLKPLVQQLVDANFAHVDTDSIVELEIKEIANEVFNRDILANRSLLLAAFLDPRLQSLTPENDVAYIENEFRQMCRQIDVAEPMTKIEPTVKKQEATPPAGGNRKSGLEFFFSNKDKKPTKRNVGGFEKEFMRFQEDANEQFSQCPLTWWAESSYSFPYLRHAADKFMCVPAMLKPIAGVLVENVQLSDRRVMLRSRCVDERIWLFANNE